MFKLKQHIFIKATTIILVIAFLLPNVVSLIHNIEHNHEHQSELCDNPNDTHLHKVENDCDFCKLKINKNYHTVYSTLNFVRVTISKVLSFRSYSFQYNYQNLSFSLRAPPALV